SSWDRWAALFEEAGYVAVRAGWPDDPDTVEEAKDHPEVFARKSESYSVPGPGKPLFQAASANLNPWTEAKVDTKDRDRGPLLIVVGDRDHTVPPAVAKASYEKQRRNPGVTEYVEIPGRGHSLTIDHGWREVADVALRFVSRFA